MFQIAGEQHAEARAESLVADSGRLGWERLKLRVYLNTHPSELGSPELIESLASVRERFPKVALYLEVHEAAALSVPCLCPSGRS